MKTTKSLVCLAALFVVSAAPVAKGQYVYADGYVHQSVIYRSEPLLPALLELPLQVTGLTIDLLFGTTLVVDDQPVYVQSVYTQPVYDEPVQTYVEPTYAPPVQQSVAVSYIDPNWEPEYYYPYGQYSVAYYGPNADAVFLCGGVWAYASASLSFSFGNYVRNYPNVCRPRYNDRCSWPSRRIDHDGWSGDRRGHRGDNHGFGDNRGFGNNRGFGDNRNFGGQGDVRGPVRGQNFDSRNFGNNQNFGNRSPMNRQSVQQGQRRQLAFAPGNGTGFGDNRPRRTVNTDPLGQIHRPHQQFPGVSGNVNQGLNNNVWHRQDARQNVGNRNTQNRPMVGTGQPHQFQGPVQHPNANAQMGRQNTWTPGPSRFSGTPQAHFNAAPQVHTGSNGSANHRR